MPRPRDPTQTCQKTDIPEKSRYVKTPHLELGKVNDTVCTQLTQLWPFSAWPAPSQHPLPRSLVWTESRWQLSLGNSPTTSNSVWQLLATATRPVLSRKGCSIGIGQGHQPDMRLGAVPPGTITEQATPAPSQKGGNQCKTLFSSVVLGPPWHRQVPQPLRQHGQRELREAIERHIYFCPAKHALLQRVTCSQQLKGALSSPVFSVFHYSVSLTIKKNLNWNTCQKENVGDVTPLSLPEVTASRRCVRRGFALLQTRRNLGKGQQFWRLM